MLTQAGFAEDFSFDRLIAPKDARAFFADDWDQRPVVISRQDPIAYLGMPGLDEIDRTISADPAGLALHNFSARGLLPVAVPDDPTDLDGVLRRLEQGGMLTLSRAERRLPTLGRICRILHATLGFRTTAQVAVSIHGVKAGPAVYHGDGQFILQVDGRRRWYLAERRQPAPYIADGTLHVDLAEDGMQVDLEPGDLLYLPRGWPCQAAGMGAQSVEIRLALHAPRWSELIAAGTGPEIDVPGGPELSRLLPPGWCHQPAADLAQELSRRWPECPDADTALDAVEKMITHEVRGFRIDIAGRLSSLVRPRPVTRLSRLGARSDLLWQMKEAGATVRLMSGPLTFDTDGAAQEAIRFALTTPSYTAADLPGPLPMDARVRLLDRLARDGLIRHADAVTFV